MTGMTGITDTEPSTLPFGWKEHEFRSLIHAETHARPVPPIIAPATIRRVAFMSVDRGKDLAALHRQMSALAGAVEGARQLTFEVRDLSVTWEMHNEFVTLTWRSAPDQQPLWPEGIGLEWHAKLAFVSASQVDILNTETIGEDGLASYAPYSLCHSAIYGGQAVIATDFLPDADQFVRFTVAAGRCGAQRCGVIARRLLEIETYRCFALLGLPVARAQGAKVQAYESSLLRIMQHIGEQSTPEAHELALNDLHRLSVEASRTVEDTSFRFAATQAYGEVLANRLMRLGEAPLDESTTLTRYLDNRIQPALATCRAMEKRLTELTYKVRRSIELLDTTITVSIQTQNQEVLDTILSTAQSQYRLQETVEGLSIIAITYYGLGILSYLLEGVHDALPIAKPVLLSVAAPIIGIMVFFLVRRLRRHKGAS